MASHRTGIDGLAKFGSVNRGSLPGGDVDFVVNGVKIKNIQRIG